MLNIKDPVLNENSVLIIEDELENNSLMLELMKKDLSRFSSELQNTVLRSMLNMHKVLAEECGDLDVSLSTTDEIKSHTVPWYVIFDNASSEGNRFIRMHYKADWETCHGVEVIIINASKLLYVGNCGYISELGESLSDYDQQFNYIKD